MSRNFSEVDITNILLSALGVIVIAFSSVIWVIFRDLHENVEHIAMQQLTVSTQITRILGSMGAHEDTARIHITQIQANTQAIREFHTLLSQVMLLTHRLGQVERECTLAEARLKDLEVLNR